jgi:hypothetical protein
MYHTHDPATGATPLPAPLLADAGAGSSRATGRETARSASRDSRDPGPWSASGAEREPRGAVEAYYAQPTLRHAPSFY